MPYACLWPCMPFIISTNKKRHTNNTGRVHADETRNETRPLTGTAAEAAAKGAARAGAAAARAAAAAARAIRSAVAAASTSTRWRAARAAERARPARVEVSEGGSAHAVVEGVGGKGDVVDDQPAAKRVGR